MKISKSILFPIESQARHVLLFNTYIHGHNGGPGIKTEKELW